MDSSLLLVPERVESLKYNLKSWYTRWGTNSLSRAPTSVSYRVNETRVLDLSTNTNLAVERGLPLEPVMTSVGVL